MHEFQCILKGHGINGVSILDHDFVREDVGGLYRGVPDDELALLAARNQPHAYSELLNRFTKIMLTKIAALRPYGIDADDLMQECSLGLLSAVRGFSPGEGASFRTYAGICIDNRLRSAIRGSTRAKHKPLSGYMELSDFEQTNAIELADAGADPEAQILINESVAELKQRTLSLLSDVEYRVFQLYLAGRSYQQIANALNITTKAVDNAVQRVRRKLKKVVSAN